MEDGRIALTRWLAESVSGGDLWENERAFLRDFCLKNKMERLLLAGCAPDADWTAAGGGRVWRQGAAAGADVQAACGQMPWQNALFDGVFLIHETDFVADLAVSLADVYRITRPYGYALMTGFNPHSLWRWGQAAGWVRAARPLAQVKAAAAAAGWQVAGGRFFAYLPHGWGRRLRFWAAAGDRWWPQAAAAYVLVLHKKPLGVRPNADWAAEAVLDRALAAAARVSRFDVFSKI